jgi:allophanate hydrolase subunit 2
VPAGSVAIGGGYGGIYPFASPGGWHLLGRSSFDAFAGDHAVFSLGDAVRFVEVDGDRSTPSVVDEGAPTPTEPHAELTRVAGPALLVDGGRTGRMHEGVPHGGPLVRSRFLRANGLAGNDAAACAIEFTGTLEVTAVGGPIVVADDERRVVLSAGERHAVSTGGVSRVRYLTIAGGIDAPVRLGGRGALLVAGIGRPLKRGDRFAPLTKAGASRTTGAVVEPDAISVLPGPDVIEGFGLDRLASSELRISPSSDRTGTRLEGAAFPVGGDALFGALARPSAPMVVGAIELTPSGLIVLGPDHPTTGGYPVIAVVRDRGLDAFFSKPIGAPVRFAIDR